MGNTDTRGESSGRIRGSGEHLQVDRGDLGEMFAGMHDDLPQDQPRLLDRRCTNSGCRGDRLEVVEVFLLRQGAKLVVQLVLRDAQQPGVAGSNLAFQNKCLESKREGDAFGPRHGASLALPVFRRLSALVPTFLPIHLCDLRIFDWFQPIQELGDSNAPPTPRCLISEVALRMCGHESSISSRDLMTVPPYQAR